MAAYRSPPKTKSAAIKLNNDDEPCKHTKRTTAGCTPPNAHTREDLIGNGGYHAEKDDRDHRVFFCKQRTTRCRDVESYEVSNGLSRT
jgi:hypothetical protein